MKKEIKRKIWAIFLVWLPFAFVLNLLKVGEMMGGIWTYDDTATLLLLGVSAFIIDLMVIFDIIWDMGVETWQKKKNQKHTGIRYLSDKTGEQDV